MHFLCPEDVSTPMFDPQSSGCSDDNSSDDEWMFMEKDHHNIGPEIWNISEEDINADLNGGNALPHIQNHVNLA